MCGTALLFYNNSPKCPKDRVSDLRSVVLIVWRQASDLKIATDPAKIFKMSSLQDKIIAITGAGSGIGRATAELFFERGATLSLSDINARTLKDVSAALLFKDPDTTEVHSARLHTQVVDVVKSDEVSVWFGSIMRRFGKLDGAVNLAGISGSVGANIGEKEFQQLTDDDFGAVIDVNVKGVFNCMRAEVQCMSGERGSIVNAASVAGLIGIATGAPYSTSKANITFSQNASESQLMFLLARSHRAYQECGEGTAEQKHSRQLHCSVSLETIITSNSYLLRQRGIIQTPMIDGIAGAIEQMNIPRPQGRNGTPQEVAKFIAFLLSDESTYTTGSVHVIDGGWLC